ncbi:hypothetical protein HK105_205535 [Polyrhizophydium stewartii]|uniref:Uncharacterized protein n=1 Tax=Polyrhizophydium stewartii TaxID=2732419 RepID=A0ABR4N635_9FUNG
MMLELRRIAIWIDAMECDWQGDLRSLPTRPLGLFEHAIRTRSMLVRLLEFDKEGNKHLYTAALSNHWEDAIPPNPPGRPEFAAAMSGRTDILRNLIETGKVILCDTYSIADALVSRHLEMFNWIVKSAQRKFPDFEIPAIMLDPSIHELLKDPPLSFFWKFGRRVALICPEPDVRDPQQTRISSDPIALEILFRRFGSTIDFSKFEIPFRTIETLEWARSRGLTRDKAKVAQSIARFAETANVAEWACERIGVVFEQSSP